MVIQRRIDTRLSRKARTGGPKRRTHQILSAANVSVVGDFLVEGHEDTAAFRCCSCQSTPCLEVEVGVDRRPWTIISYVLRIVEALSSRPLSWPILGVELFCWRLEMTSRFGKLAKTRQYSQPLARWPVLPVPGCPRLVLSNEVEIEQPPSSLYTIQIWPLLEASSPKESRPVIEHICARFLSADYTPTII